MNTPDFACYGAERSYCISPTKGWYRRECKDCTRHRHQRDADQDRQAIREYNRAYYRANKDKLDKRSADWINENPERRRTALHYYYNLQHDAITAYGGYRCSWCGINEPMILTLDHINNDGHDHRRVPLVAISSTSGCAIRGILQVFKSSA